MPTVLAQAVTPEIPSIPTIKELKSEAQGQVGQQTAVNRLLVEAQEQALIRQLNYSEFVIDIREESFKWQLLSSKIIFGVVVLIVLAGVLFSAIQFFKDPTIFRPGPAAMSNSKVQNQNMFLSSPQVTRLQSGSNRSFGPATTGASDGSFGPATTGASDGSFGPATTGTLTQPQSNNTPGTTSLTIGPGQVQLTSSILGVIILGLSLGFFYLYLQYVYPITEVRTTTAVADDVGN